MDTRAETALIGALMMDNGQWKRVKSIIAIGKEVDAGHSVDSVVVAEICASDTWSKTDVVTRLIEATSTCETSALAPRYAREAKKQWATWKYNDLLNGGLEPATPQNIGERADKLRSIADSLMDVEEESGKGKTLAEVAKMYRHDYFCDKAKAPYDTGFPLLDETVSLAPGDYETRQRVWIRYNGEDADTVVIYYTIDGQSPTSNSPIYTGDPIYLPGGRIHVKAVAVNTYGKISNEMDVEMKINISFLRYFNSKDTFEGYKQDITLYCKRQ